MIDFFLTWTWNINTNKFTKHILIGSFLSSLLSFTRNNQDQILSSLYVSDRVGYKRLICDKWVTVAGSEGLLKPPLRPNYFIFQGDIKETEKISKSNTPLYIWPPFSDILDLPLSQHMSVWYLWHRRAVKRLWWACALEQSHQIFHCSHKELIRK